MTSTIDSCPCGFVSSMLLPCKHILAVRMSYSLPEYDESFCAERWKLRHFLSNHRAYSPSNSSGSDVDGSDVDGIKQKYRKAFKVAQNLCQQLSTFSNHDFNEGLEILQSVASLWDGGKKVFVREATGIAAVYCRCICYVTVCASHLAFSHFV